MPSDDVIPEVCIAYDICVAGKTITTACQDLPRRIVQRVLKGWQEKGLVNVQHSGKKTSIEYSKLCDAYQRYLDCLKKNEYNTRICMTEAGLR